MNYLEDNADDIPQAKRATSTIFNKRPTKKESKLITEYFLKGSSQIF
jgi:hypothetical protein